MIRRTFVAVGKFIAGIIDFFYPPFSKHFSLQFFRYGFSGAINLVLSWFTYFIIFQFILQKRLLNFGFVVVSAHSGALGINFVITLLTGFFLQKYVTFTASELRGHKQLIRYAMVAILNLFINYLGLKALVETFQVFPSIANVIVSLFVTIISYFLQTKFTFPIKNNVAEEK